ncbi:MAG: serine/threonine protein kinase [Lachnospiraceae bacterium]|nr:serine/threonine protein kinase [Lachnospiraceae bacterium]
MNSNYRIVELLSKSKMSEVYLAVDNIMARKWIIKKISCKDEYVRMGIFNELNSLKKLHDRRIAAIRECFIENEKVCLVMEYIEGMNLKQIAEKNPEFASEKALEWGIQIAKIITMLHQNTPAIIYRDLKPQNVILQPDGVLCLIDFGAAKAKTGSEIDKYAVGTEEYAAPEQRMGVSDEKTDIYNFGKTLEKISGKKNIAGLKYIIKKCTESREKRYTSMSMVLRDLKRVEFFHRWRRLAAAGFIVSLIITSLLFDYALMKKRAGEEKAYYIKEMADVESDYLFLASKLDKTKEALDKIDADCTESGEFSGKLYLQCGMAAFDELNDYERAADYFLKAEENGFSAACTYKEISYELSGFPDKKSLRELLKKLNSDKRIANDEEKVLIEKKIKELIKIEGE